MNILIMGTNRFPRGDAGALREESFAKLFSSMGHQVHIVGLGSSTQYKWRDFEGFHYISLRSSKTNKISRILNRINYYNRLLNQVLKKENYDVIFITSGSNTTIKGIKKYAKRNNIHLVIDSVEWYSPEQFKFGVLSKAYRDKDILNRQIIDKTFSVVAISSFLQNHFENKGINTVRIPVILDVDKYPFEKKTKKEKVIFMYAGMPGKKDYLSVIIAGFAQLTDKEIKSCELRLVGVTEQELIEQCDVDEKDIAAIGDSLHCIGRVPHNKVQKMLSEADFTVLLRKSESRYAKAGFPTKFVESLASGTPAICNYSSDLQMYIINEENAIVCDGCSADAMENSLRKAIQMPYDKRQKMQLNSRKTAEKHFNYKAYSSVIEKALYISQ